MFNNPKTGFQNADAYLASGLPFVTSSINPSTGSVDFHHITKQLLITASGSDAKIYFQADTTDDRKFIVLSNTTVPLDVRVCRVFFESDGTVSIFASLTTIESEMMPNLSSSLWTGI